MPALDGVDLVHSDAALVDGEGTPSGSTLLGSLELSAWERDRMQHGRAFEALLRRNLVTGATVLVRRDAAIGALPVPDGWIHDEWLAIVCALDGGVRLVPEVTIDYRQHASNQIGVRRLSSCDKIARVLADDGGAQLRKAVRAESLAREAVARRLGDPERRRVLQGKARHERERAALPVDRIRRLPRIARWLLAGRYRQFSRGLPDAVRDALQRR